MRRLALLFAAGTLWLFLAAIPAFADGGPHVASDNSGVSTLTADGCAGCHRAHTAQGEGLLVEANEQALCESCHGATATGAATDVMTGVQYVKGSITDPSKAGDPILGYLRDGGFQQAHIGGADGQLIRVGYYRSSTDVSFRMKVPAEATADNVTSAHIDLDGVGGVTAKQTVWGNGVSNATEPILDLECAACHNPHGNGQYRILQKFVGTEGVVAQTPVGIDQASATTDRFVTDEAHSLIVGDIVTISGVTGIASTPAWVDGGKYIVKAIAGNTFTVAPTSATPTTADITNTAIDITTSGTGGTVTRWASIVDDAPLPTGDDTRNYTIIQTKGTQGTNTTYMLYESNVLAARGSGTFNGIAGTYSETAGDYFHRTVPWNPGINTAACAGLTGSAVPASSCTANDAPNGRPATVTTAGQGAIAFNDQISAWCATCHTRYYSSTNANPGIYENNPAALEPASSAATSKTITGATGNVMTTSAAHGFALGDIVHFGTDATNWYVVQIPTTTTFAVSATFEGAPASPPATSGNVIREYPFSASSWYFPRNGSDDAYKFQHQTTTNRACTTCHVGHGSDAVMATDGDTTFSADLAYPDGTAATAGYNSRLLKIDNRGTCQACHDPTGTATAGTVYGTNPGPLTVP